MWEISEQKDFEQSNCSNITHKHERQTFSVLEITRTAWPEVNEKHRVNFDYVDFEENISVVSVNPGKQH